MQSRYTDHLTDLRLQDPRPISTAEMDFLKIKPTALSTKPDPVRYDKEDTVVVEELKTRNSQLELVRLLGAEVVSQNRDQVLTAREIYEALFGLCLMRYKRDTVMRKLIQRLRLPEYYQKLSLEVKFSVLRTYLFPGGFCLFVNLIIQLDIWGYCTNKRQKFGSTPVSIR